MSGNSVLLNRFQQVSLGESWAWPRGVTVSTLDSESSDRGANPREAFLFENVQYFGGCDLSETSLQDHGWQLLMSKLPHEKYCYG